jgi:hypothetical protein
MDLGAPRPWIRGIVFGADESIVVVRDTEIQLWRFGYGRLLEAASKAAGRNLTHEEWLRYFGSYDYSATFSAFGSE